MAIHQSSYKNRVPREISADEKDEIRKWVWRNLLEFMELKMKVGWVLGERPLKAVVGVFKIFDRLCNYLLKAFTRLS